MKLGCLGSDRVERSYQPRLIALPIVPDYLRNAWRLRGPSSDSLSIWRNGLTPFLGLTIGAGAPSISSKNRRQLNILQTVVLPSNHEEESYGQAARLISTSQLNASLRFHTWPINLVVYQEPSGVLRPGTSHLVEGFTLRCLQRFSLPDVATRRCRWRDNRYTRGPSNPVLSY